MTTPDPETPELRAPRPAFPVLSRRSALKMSGLVAIVGATSVAGVVSAANPQTLVAPRPKIRPRSDWAGNLKPVGPLVREDVKFLIIHHSQSPNGYSRAKVPATLRSFYHFHTGTKGWPDVAYNFFVDEYGVIWEGRAGSLAKPVQGSATGGNQGFSQLCCFVGDFTARPPSAAAMRSMAQLLAWLAGRYQIDLSGRTPITFTSRGSNKWRRGRKVTAKPVAGHRDMSMTACPGDALYALITGTLTKSALAVATGRAIVPTTPQPAKTPKPTPADPSTSNTGATPKPSQTSEASRPVSSASTTAGTGQATSVTTSGQSTVTAEPTSSHATSVRPTKPTESTNTAAHAGEYTAHGWTSGAYTGAGIVGAGIVGALTWAAYRHHGKTPPT